MGNNQSIQKISFEDMLFSIRHQWVIINTMDETRQDCLIANTIPASMEVMTINSIIQKREQYKTDIIIYGENACCPKLEQKAKSLISLGFPRVYIYMGGLFEWLLLGDIYGDDEFPTTKKELDILRYKPSNRIVSHLLTQ
jgi:hypothetical protein